MRLQLPDYQIHLNLILEIFKSYKDERFKYFYSDVHTSLYEARNLAIEKTQGDFLSFVKEVWPDFVEGYHHRIYAEKLNRRELFKSTG